MKHGKNPEKDGEELKKEVDELRVELISRKKDLDCLKAEADAQKSKAEEYKNLLQRVQADFENYMRRSDTERRELMKNASKDLVAKLLDVVDSMDAALKAEPNGVEGAKILDGFRRVNAQLKSVLSAEGLEEIASDGAFDHDCQEAVGTVEDAGRRDGTIAEVVQRGYMLNGRIIRTAKVIVVKNGGESNG